MPVYCKFRKACCAAISHRMHRNDMKGGCKCNGAAMRWTAEMLSATVVSALSTRHLEFSESLKKKGRARIQRKMPPDISLGPRDTLTDDGRRTHCESCVHPIGQGA
jgi:hypothetical protein